MLIYYFDGSGGCDRCQSLTGYSFELPARPHRYCDCLIEEVDVALDSFEIEYRNLLVLADIVESSESFSFDFCSADHVSTIDLFVLEDEEDDLSSGLREFASHEWSPPETEILAETVFVPAHHVATGASVVDRYAADLLADVYMVGVVGEQSFESELEPEHGHYEKNVRLRVEDMDFVPCFVPC